MEGVLGPLSGDCVALISKFMRIRFVMLTSVDGATCRGVEEVRSDEMRTRRHDGQSDLDMVLL